MAANTTQTPLTERQQEILDSIISLTQKNGRSPTIREIGAAVGIKSPNGVMANLTPLMAKGHITRDLHSSRGIRVVGFCPCCGRKDEDVQPVEWGGAVE